MKIPTDLEILRSIYDNYYSKFESYKTNGKNDRLSKIYVPIDVDKIGAQLMVDGDIIFGRLYYHFNQKFNYTHDDGAKVSFFALEIGPVGQKDKHCIQFPYMASVLADLQNEEKKFKVATWMALVSIVISICALIISLV